MNHPLQLVELASSYREDRLRAASEYRRSWARPGALQAGVALVVSARRRRLLRRLQQRARWVEEARTMPRLEALTAALAESLDDDGIGRPREWQPPRRSAEQRSQRDLLSPRG